MAEINRNRAISIWLLLGVFMIIVQIVLGGITRLTDSGLSITEWKPILGAVPPRSESDWQKAFDHYKQIAQFKHLHSYFSLEDFKSIYFWEWLHRLWGRIIGIVFIIPFLFFLFTGRFNRQMVKPLVILFLLGGLQGLIGWIMVQSGLNDENLYVSHIRLAVHFIVALVLLVYTFWFALQLLVNESHMSYKPSSANLLLVIIGLLAIQLVYGAFMAGLKAAASAPTWPAINGEIFPSNMSSYAGKDHSFFSSLVNNPITVHFIHRNLAYLLLVLVGYWTMFVNRDLRGVIRWSRWLPLALVLLQAVFGIVTVLTSPQRVPQRWGVFEWNALAHQFVAMLLLLSLIFCFYTLRKRKLIPQAVDPHLI
jgi:heme a synthase